MAELNERQQKFVSEYLVDLNATQAAIRAGYSKKTAYSLGQRLLKKVEIQAAIEEARADQQKRTEITQDMVLAELAKVAFANGADFARVITKECTDGNGNPTTLQTVELVDTDELDDDKKAAISCIKEGKFGIEVGSYDKLRALELLGRHLGMFDRNTISAKPNVDVEDDPLTKSLKEEAERLNNANQ